MPAKKRIKPPKRPVQAKSHFWKPTTLAGWFWTVLVGIITLAGGWTFVRPVVHVEPYVQLNPGSPFTERFKVSNDGNLDINDLKFECFISLRSETNSVKDLRAWNNLLDADPPYVKTIVASGTTTIGCPIDRMLGIENEKQYHAAELTFSVKFTPSMYPWKKQACFGFVGVLDVQNKAQWTYKNNECFK
jgi:hypothetical protein